MPPVGTFGNSVSHMTDRVFCRCDSRSRAVAIDGFRFDAQCKGWIFPADKPRSVSDPWKANYYGIVTHAGEPYVHVTCPFCGADLPFIDPEPPAPAEFCNGED